MYLVNILQRHGCQYLSNEDIDYLSNEHNSCMLSDVLLRGVINPEIVGALYFKIIGMYYHYIHKSHQQSLIYYNKALELDNNDTYVHLGLLYLQEMKQTDLAMETFQRHNGIMGQRWYGYLLCQYKKNYIEAIKVFHCVIKDCIDNNQPIEDIDIKNLNLALSMQGYRHLADKVKLS